MSWHITWRLKPYELICDILLALWWFRWLKMCGTDGMHVEDIPICADGVGALMLVRMGHIWSILQNRESCMGCFFFAVHFAKKEKCYALYVLTLKRSVRLVTTCFGGTSHSHDNASPPVATYVGQRQARRRKRCAKVVK